MNISWNPWHNMTCKRAMPARLRMFFAVLNKRTAAVKALLEGGARLEVPGQNRANADSNQNSPPKLATTWVLSLRWSTTGTIPAWVSPPPKSCLFYRRRGIRWSREEDRKTGHWMGHTYIFPNVPNSCRWIKSPFVVKAALPDRGWLLWFQVMFRPDLCVTPPSSECYTLFAIEFAKLFPRENTILHVSKDVNWRQ